MTRPLTLLEPAETDALAQDHAERELIRDRIRAAQFPVPEHLHGKLYGVRDLYASVLGAIDAKAAASKWRL